MNSAILRRLRQLGLPLQRGADAGQIGAAEAVIGNSLHPSLRALYLDHNGQKCSWPWEYRLLALEEVVDTHRAFQRSRLAWMMARLGFVLFWSNDNSDYAGMFLREPLSGTVAIMEHDGEPFAIAYRRLEHFYSDQIDHYTARKQEDAEEEGGVIGMIGRWMRVLPSAGGAVDQVEAELDRWYIELPDGQLRRPTSSQELLGARSQRRAWNRRRIPRGEPGALPTLRDMPTDFPGPGLMPLEEELTQDRERVRTLKALLDEPEAQDQLPLLYSMICAFTPMEDSGDLISLLDSDDFFVAEAAARSLGIRRWKPAIPALERLAAKKVANSPAAAAGALRAMQPDPALEALLVKLETARFDGHDSLESILEGLLGHGYEVIQRWEWGSEGEIRCRPPGHKRWLVVYRPN